MSNSYRNGRWGWPCPEQYDIVSVAGGTSPLNIHRSRGLSQPFLTITGQVRLIRSIVFNYRSGLLNPKYCFFFKFKFLFGPRSILWSHWLLLFWTSCVLPHGFQIQSGYLACTLSCLRAVILKVTTGATPAFSTNRGVHCISMYTAWLTRLLLHASGFDPPIQLLSGAWLSQMRYRLNYSAEVFEVFCWQGFPSN